MITLDRITGKLKNNGRPITRKHKGWRETVCQFICAEIANGKSILNIVSEEIGGHTPDFVEFNDWLHEDAKLKTEYGKALSLRLTHLRERFVQVLNKAKGKEEFEELKAISQGIKEFMQDQDMNITINVHSHLPEGLWEKTHEVNKKQVSDDL